MNLRTNLSQLPERAFTDGRVSFREIRSEDDLAWATCELQLTPDQQDLVNPAGFSIGRAYLFPEDNIPYLICLEGQEDPIGFILLRFTHWVDDPNCWCYYSKCEPRTNWSYFIDSRYQGQGYGRAAAQLAVRILRKAAPEFDIEVTTEQENEKAQNLYLSIGFEKADELDGDDFVYLYKGREDNGDLGRISV